MFVTKSHYLVTKNHENVNVCYKKSQLIDKKDAKL